MRHAGQSVAEYRQNADLDGERDARCHRAERTTTATRPFSRRGRRRRQGGVPCGTGARRSSLRGGARPGFPARPRAGFRTVGDRPEFENARGRQDRAWFVEAWSAWGAGGVRPGAVLRCRNRVKRRSRVGLMRCPFRPFGVWTTSASTASGASRASNSSSSSSVGGSAPPASSAPACSRSHIPSARRRRNAARTRLHRQGRQLARYRCRDRPGAGRRGDGAANPRRAVRSPAPDRAPPSAGLRGTRSAPGTRLQLAEPVPRHPGPATREVR